MHAKPKINEAVKKMQLSRNSVKPNTEDKYIE